MIKWASAQTQWCHQSKEICKEKKKVGLQFQGDKNRAGRYGPFFFFGGGELLNVITLINEFMERKKWRKTPVCDNNKKSWGLAGKNIGLAGKPLTTKIFILFIFLSKKITWYTFFFLSRTTHLTWWSAMVISQSTDNIRSLHGWPLESTSTLLVLCLTMYSCKIQNKLTLESLGHHYKRSVQFQFPFLAVVLSVFKVKVNWTIVCGFQ